MIDKLSLKQKIIKTILKSCTSSLQKSLVIRQSGACCHSFRIFNIVLLLVDIAMILPRCFILAYVPFVTAAK